MCARAPHDHLKRRFDPICRMIRYEIFSNIAGSEQGLRDYPELMDLADALAVKDIETRFVRQVVREEEQINVASQKTAKGVTVRQTAVKTLQPQTSLRGCLNWMRAISGKIDRGMHLQLDTVRSSNGAGLVFSQVFARNQKVFVSGIDDGNWERMVARADITLKRIPSVISKSIQLRNEYRQRGARPASFYPLLLQMSDMDFLPPEFITKVQERLPNRDPNRLRDFSEAEVINIGLLFDVLERYKKLVDDLVAVLCSGEQGKDLQPLFNLLTQGVSYEELRKALLPFTQENKRSRITTKRVLIDELRIFLSRNAGKPVELFTAKLLATVVRARAHQDPVLYRKVVPLKLSVADKTETLTAVRQLYRPVFEAMNAIAPSRVDPAAPSDEKLKQKFFEMLVGLTYLGEFSAIHRGGMVPPKAQMARELIDELSFDGFKPAQLYSLNPKLPATGVAQSLCKKVSLNMGDLLKNTQKLNQSLFPYVKLAADISLEIQAENKDKAAQHDAEIRIRYLEGAFPLLRITHYKLGKAGLNASMHAAALAAGRRLGLSFVAAESAAMTVSEGVVALMDHEGKTFLPLSSDRDYLARAYRYLYGERAAEIVRRFVAKKINYLLDLHQKNLFEVIYQHVVSEQQLHLSRYQLGMLLYQEKVFDKNRLLEFGFVPGGMENGHQRDNPWLHKGDQKEEEQPYAAGRIEKAYQSAHRNLAQLLKIYAEQSPEETSSGKEALVAIIGEQSRKGVCDPFAPAFREALAASDASRVLWEELQEVISTHFKQDDPVHEEAAALELTLPAALAYLTLLKDSHAFTLAGRQYRFRIKGGWGTKPGDLNPLSQVIVKGLSERLHKHRDAPNIRLLKAAVETLQGYCRCWRQVSHVSELVVIDQVLQSTILTLILPAPPQPEELRKIPPTTMLCLGVSSSDQSKFHKINARSDLKENYATLSQLANWLETFQRLREEMDDVRAIVADVVEIIQSFQVSVFEAPYILRYASKLRELDEALSVPAESMDDEALKRLQKIALELEALRREFFEKETEFAPKDRWLNRVTIRLRQVRPATDLGFVQHLYDSGAKVPDDSQKKADAESSVERQQKERFQNFTQRAHNVIHYRNHLRAKSVFVLSPNSFQRDLTINVIDRLLRVKGIFTPILADVSNCESFIDVLHTRLPAHRLFNMNTL